MFSINTSFYELWPAAEQAFLDYLVSDKNMAGKAYSLRYGGSIVSDVHRILMEGGLFYLPGQQPASPRQAAPDVQMQPPGFYHGTGRWTGYRWQATPAGYKTG